MLEQNINMISGFQDSSFILAKQIIRRLKDEILILNNKNKKLRASIKKHEDFKKFMGKTVHDLQSPLLSIGVIANADELPEHKRVALKSAMINAMDITNEALNQFSPRRKRMPENSKRQPVLVSAILTEIIEDRKCRYAKSPI